MVKLHEEKKLRVLVVMSDKRLPGALANVPTAKEQGYDLNWTIWRGFYLGPKVSDADYAWWVDTLKKLVKTPEFAKEREARGLYPIDSLGADFDKRVKADVATFKKLKADAGL